MSGLLDFLQGASNSAAGTVTAPVDGLAWLLRKAGVPVPANPVGGSDWMRQKGLLADPQDRTMGLLGESVGGVLPMLAAAKAPQIARGLLQMGENAATPSSMANQGQRGMVVASLSKRGDPKDAGAFIKDAIEANGGKMPYEDIAKMNREEFAQFYDHLPPHHQGKFDRLLRAYAPQYDDLPTTMSQYAKDFMYENPRLVRSFKNVGPDDMVPIYRSVSKADPDLSVVPGDWVALEKAYAANHGHLGTDAPRLLQSKVPAKDIRWAGTSADEYFYVPSSGIDQNIGTKYDALLRSLGLK